MFKEGKARAAYKEVFMKIVRTAVVLLLILLGCVSCTPAQKNGEDSFSSREITNKPAIKIKKAVESTGTSTVTEYDESGNEIRGVHYNEDSEIVFSYTCDYDENGNLLYSVSDGNGLGGREYTAEYNEFGYPVKIHIINNDPTRDIGMYDITTEYEYVYYDTRV